MMNGIVCQYDYIIIKLSKVCRVFLLSYIISLASAGSNSITPSILGTSANALQEDNSIGGECDGEEDGAHDTITSLAGVKMIQKYRGSIRKGRRSSQSEDQFSGHQRLEDLFLIEEDGKDDTTYDEPLEIISRDDYGKQTDNIGTLIFSNISL